MIVLSMLAMGLECGQLEPFLIRNREEQRKQRRGGKRQAKVGTANGDSRAAHANLCKESSLAEKFRDSATPGKRAAQAIRGSHVQNASPLSANREPVGGSPLEPQPQPSTLPASMAVPATNGTPSSTKHKLQCFVEIPPSPLHKTHRMTLSSQTPSSTNSSLKENTPFRPSRSNSDSTVMTSLTSLSSRSSKRKLPIDVDDSDRLSDPTQAESPLVKKPKLSAHSQSAASKGKVAQNKKPLDDDDIITLDEEFTHQDYPNGWFYCHQCAKKRDASCTLLLSIHDFRIVLILT